jgi:hypothetical protein
MIGQLSPADVINQPPADVINQPPADVINRFIQFSELKNMMKFKFDEECKICKIELADHNIVKMLECKHVFHQLCINDYSKNTKCPTCNC